MTLTRIEDVSRLAWGHVPSAWSHSSYYEPIVERVLSAALDAAEASGELPSEYLMRACFQAREKETT